MEIRSKTMVGLPVFTTTQGEKLGQVKDYVFHPEKKAILALVISKGKPFGEELILPMRNIKSLGHGAVTVTDATTLLKKEDDAEIAQYLKRMANIVGVRVMTTEGTPLGTVSEFHMDTVSGAITLLVLAGSVREQIFRGKNHITSQDIEVFGTDVILAKEKTTPQSMEKNESEKEPKEAHSNSIWNRSFTAAKSKTKIYRNKDVPTVFSEVPQEKKEEEPIEEEIPKHSKGTIHFKGEA